jgi:photosystem II stability/assembly factor-like uncharacterized protein
MHNKLRLAGAMLAAISGTALAGPGVWTSNGPDGGEVSYLVADPVVVDTLIASGRGGLFRSIDAGNSWQRFETGIAFTFPYGLEMASAASTAFAAPGIGSLYRSDAGGSWMPTALAVGAGESITDLSLRAGNGQFLVVSTSGGVQLSSDGGATFAMPASIGLPSSDDVLRIEYASATRLYALFGQTPAGAGSPIFRSDDGGASWSATAALPDPFTFLSYHRGDLESAASDPQRVYASFDSGVYVSSNGGASWAACAASAPAGGKISIAAGNPDHVWLSGELGVYSSINGCASWTQRTTGLSSDGFRTDTTSTIALAPTFPGDARVWVGSVSGGLYRSTNGGASFAAINSGFVSSNIRSIAMHPVDPNTILLGYGDAFDPSPTLFRSSDGGNSWPRANIGLAASQLRGLAIDPTTAASAGTTHIYAVGTSRLNGSPTPGSIDGGIYKSIDGASSWSAIDNGLPATYFGTRFIGSVRSVVLDPRSCATPPASGPCTSGPLQTLYVTASGRPNSATGLYDAARVYKSINAGMSWTASENGLPAASVAAGACFQNQIAVPLVIDPTASSTLYLGLFANFSSDASCAPPTLANGVFKSIDGGANWIHASNGLPRLGGPGTSHWNVLALAIDPDDAQTLYAGASEYSSTGGYNGRVFKSTDGGANWSDSSVGIAGQDVRALLVDPGNSSVVYAGIGGSPANPSGVYRSDDGGLTWNSFSIDLPADAATALAIDPHDPARLLAGTPSGLWELTQVADGDADGASTATENGAPNGGDADASGTPDAQESNVASLTGVPSARPNAPSPRGTPLPQITLSVQPLLGTCTRINNAHAIDADRLPADMARGVAATAFDRGVLRFELPDCRRARVTVVFHGADFGDVDWTWRNYGPLTPGDTASMAWYGFESARKTGSNRWELIVDAATRGNYRDAESNILFVGAPGFADIHLFGDGFQ